MVIRRFESSRPSQAVSQLEIAGRLKAKTPHLWGFSCDCDQSPGSRKSQLGREFTESLRPKLQKLPFEGDFGWRQLSIPLRGRGSSNFSLCRTCILQCFLLLPALDEGRMLAPGALGSDTLAIPLSDSIHESYLAL